MIQCTVGNCELTDVWKLLNWEANWAKTFTQKKNHKEVCSLKKCMIRRRVVVISW